MSPGPIILAVWAGWAISWFAAAAWSNRTEKSLGVRAELGYRLILFVGALLFMIPAHGYEGPLRLWHPGRLVAWACVGVEVAGFAFAWWARIHLGRLWSGNITKKADHRVVDTGPYAIVRHPIYTGILTAAVATTVAKGTALGVAGAVVFTAGIVMKARLEEAWLRQELGGAAYDAYRARVPMLVPFGSRGA